MTTINKKTRLLNFFRRALMYPFFEKILIAIIKSKFPLSKFIEKIVPSNYLYPAESIRSANVNGVNLTLDISEYINHWVYFNLADKGYEELIRLSSHSSLIFDVGANIGFTALSMAKKGNVESVVHAFEPDLYNFSKLKVNTLLNPESEVILNNIGLGAKNDRLKLVIDTPDNLGGNRIKREATEDFNWVTITTIDNYCEEHSLDAVDLIKIDVEGFEYNVLKGSMRLLESCKPIIFIEVDDNNLRKQGSSAEELISFLELRYNNISIAGSGKAISSQNNFTDCHFDAIAKDEN
jgi:FkbM family methyltransferase